MTCSQQVNLLRLKKITEASTLNHHKMFGRDLDDQKPQKNSELNWATLIYVEMHNAVYSGLWIHSIDCVHLKTNNEQKTKR